MQRYVVDDKLKLDYKDIKHIINVMRMHVGEKFQMINNKIIYTCEITNIEKNNILYKIIKEEKKENQKNYRVVFACSIIKEQKMDYLLQKATELGVDEIIPLITERTIVKVQNKNKIDRWERIVKEATEQSHRIDIPKINSIISLEQLINYESDIKMLCNTNEMSKNIKKVLRDVEKCDTILVVVGPEGGFSNKEVEFLIKSGFISISLGDNILRAETVPLYILSVINYEFIG